MEAFFDVAIPVALVAVFLTLCVGDLQSVSRRGLRPFALQQADAPARGAAVRGGAAAAGAFWFRTQ
jgi:hypothetical protein